MESRDRAFVQALVTTTLRRRGQVEHALAQRLQRGIPGKSGQLQRILEIAATQILFLQSAPHAVVSIAVDQVANDRDAKHFKALANAVLRGLVRDRESVLANQDAAVLNMPRWLWARWRQHYGEARTRSIATALLNEPSLDLTARDDPAGWAERLGGTVLPNRSIRINAKGALDELPGFAEGAWWVQDAAAALPAMLLGDVRGKDVADLCAAPGGKTAQLAAAGATVTAYDQSPERLERLRANLQRLGLAAEAVAADLTRPLEGRFFDAVLLDAPCSATGTIRRHPDVAWLKRESDIATLNAIQSKILANAAGMLRPGGTLVYSTCSLEPEEGERLIAAALGRLPLEIDPIGPGETGGLAESTGNGAVRTFPDGLRHDDPAQSGLAGFFIARLRRK
jgi:16S rRNA (cytosine967-C5)-methyltransferase